MFTGIIKEVGVIHSWNLKSRVLGIKSGFENLILGESISCSGVCLTVSSFKKNVFFCVWARVLGVLVLGINSAFACQAQQNRQSAIIMHPWTNNGEAIDFSSM